MTVTGTLLHSINVDAAAEKPSTDELLKSATALALGALDHLHKMLEAKIKEAGPESAAQYGLVLCKIRLDISALRRGIIHPDKSIEDRVKIQMEPTDSDKETVKKMEALQKLLQEVAMNVKLKAAVDDLKSDDD
jgi:hypothetical protein